MGVTNVACGSGCLASSQSEGVALCVLQSSSNCSCVSAWLRSGELQAAAASATAGFSGRVTSREPCGAGSSGAWGCAVSSLHAFHGRRWRRRCFAGHGVRALVEDFCLVSISAPTRARGFGRFFEKRCVQTSVLGGEFPSETGSLVDFVGFPVRFLSKQPLSVNPSWNGVTMPKSSARGRRMARVSCPTADMDSTRVDTGEEGENDWALRGLPVDLQPELMPRHVAIIMDGNSRWAKRRGMPSSFGHAAGAEAFKKVAKTASNWGIEVLTVFAFSTENWRRPQTEVEFLMNLFETKLQQEMSNVMRYKFRLRFIGDTTSLPILLQNAVQTAEEATSHNTGMIINLCVSYSGRSDIVRACQQLAAQAVEGSLDPADIDDEAITRKVFMSELGALQDPDVLIRTSGEQRISNFLLWQLAYSEFIFLDTLWPDFDEEDFRGAMVTYQRRDRRYGKR